MKISRCALEGWIVVLCLAIASSAAGAASTAEAVWTWHAPGGYIDTSPAIGDVDGDGRVDVVVASTAGGVYALDGEGNEIWRWEEHETISVPPTLADVVEAPGPEVIALTNAGRLVCLEGATGSLLWDYALSGKVNWGMTAIAAADLTGDGKLELVTADSKGLLVCLRGDGSVLWTYEEAGGLNSSPAVGDLDGDGAPEIVIGSVGTPLLCVERDGALRWRLESPGASGSGPVLADLDGDAKPEILVGIGTGLAAVSGGGTVLWSAPMKRELDSAISVGDADGDGSVEVYAVDLSGMAVCVSSDGTLKWTANVEERVRRSPSLADIDGDGVVEILVAGYSKAIHVFDPAGILEDRIELGGPTNATATVVDLKGAGQPNVVCPVGNGSLLVLAWDGAGPGRVLWPEYRFNSARMGALAPPPPAPPVTISAFDPGDAYVGANRFSVSIRNAEGKALTVRMEVIQQETRRSRKSVTARDETFAVHLPYTLSGREPVTLEFACVVLEGDTSLAEQRRRVYVVPFAPELAELGGMLEALEALVAQSPGAPELERHVYYLREQIPELRERAALAGSMTGIERRAFRDELAGLRRQYERVEALAEWAAKTDQPFLACAANPWAPFGGIEELVEGRTPPADMTVEAFYGEVESAALNVFNLAPDAESLRIEVEDITGPEGTSPVPAGDVLTVREVVATPTQMADKSADALPLLNQGRTVLVPGHDGRQIWFTVHTAALTPGTWKTRVHLRALDVHATRLEAELSITVWDTPLPKEQPLRLCHWGYVHTSILKDQPDAALQDQVDHLTNVFVGVIPPRATCDEDGNLVGKIDFAAHDAYVRRHAPHGLILFCGYQGGLTGAAHLSPAWKKAHIAYLRAWVKHLAELGVGYDGFALYPVDEPGLHEGLVEKQIEYGKLAREADPKIQSYTDPVSGATLDDLKQMTPYIDIWCPNRNGILLNPENGKLEYLLSTGKPVFTYECQDKAKHQCPLGYYRAQAWLAWHYGLTGIGFWSYCTSSFDPWYNSGESEYLLIYQGDGVIPSKRWEAIRDGIEDYSMLDALRAAADRVKAAGRASENVTAARRLLGEKASAVGRFCGLDDDGTTPGVGGLPAMRALADRRWAHIQTVRREMAVLLSQQEEE